MCRVCMIKGIDNIIGIYKIINLKNDKIYVGQSIHIEKRWIDHKCTLRKGIHRNQYLQNAWNKYGENAFKHEIIEECNILELDEKEIYWIKYYNTNNPLHGYNLDGGGKGNRNISDITREKLSIINSGKYNPMAHSVICLETLEIFETITKANSKYNIPKGEITACCNRKRKIAKGYHWMYYDKYLLSDENSINMILNEKPNSHNVKVLNITTNISYDSIKSASECTGIHRDRISKCCRGIVKSADGYEWKYIK